MLLCPFAIRFSGIQAQNEVHTVYISYEVRHPEAADYVHEFFDELQSRWKSQIEDIELVVLEPGDTQHSSTMKIIFDWWSGEAAGYGDQYPTTIELLAKPMYQISPMLYDLPSVHTQGAFDIDSWIVVSQLAYSLGLCESAKSYATQVDFLLQEWTYIVDPYYDSSYAQLIGINCNIMHHDYPEAINEFTKPIAPVRETLDFALKILTNASWVYLQTDQANEAFDLLDGFIAFNRNDLNPALSAKALLARARLRALNFEFDAALADINTAIDGVQMALNEPKDDLIQWLPPLYTERGQIHLLLYQWDNVLTDYNTALQIDPNYADTYFYRGVLYYTVVVDRDKALPDFQQYLDLAPTGIHAGEAAQYLHDIQSQLDALKK
jgi:tetratricopeptide (TPR) repeat protein